MRRSTFFVALWVIAVLPLARAQDDSAPKRGFLGRVFHPFGSSDKIPKYRNPKLNGLLLSVDLPDEPIKLSEVRQLPVTVRLTNKGKHAVELSFQSEQRIEILLHDSSGRIVTRWSDNRAFAQKASTVLIDPDEHLEYAETIATRDLSPGKVFTVEATVPSYPELDATRKSLAAP